MYQVEIRIDGNRDSFRPGEKISGIARWNLEKRAEKVELCLFWYTAGKGDRDVEVVHSLQWRNPSLTDEKDFEFELPDSPYSFSGKLISLIWALEVVVEPKGPSHRYEFTLSPTDSEIELQGKAQ